MRWSRRLQGCRQFRAEGPGSNALRPALLVLLALGHNGGTQPRAKIFGQFVKLGVAINLNGLFRGIAHHVTIVAPGKMVFEFDLGRLIDHAVQIIGQLVQEFRAFHWLPSPLLFSSLLFSSLLFSCLPFSRFWKKRPSRSRSCRRA